MAQQAANHDQRAEGSPIGLRVLRRRTAAASPFASLMVTEISVWRSCGAPIQYIRMQFTPFHLSFLVLFFLIFNCFYTAQKAAFTVSYLLYTLETIVLEALNILSFPIPALLQTLCNTIFYPFPAMARCGHLFMSTTTTIEEDQSMELPPSTGTQSARSSLPSLRYHSITN